MIDTQTCIKNDLTQMSDLTNTCTANQKEIYPLIDNLANGKILKVEMKGDAAMRAFEENVIFDKITNKVTIQLENSVEFWINASKDDFTKYVIRNRIK